MTGQTILHYRIQEKLGGGGMGVVYKAEDTRLSRTVALKFLPPEWSRDDEAKGRFIQEAQAASRLDHPNICTIYEINETDDGQLFIAMACYDGETLKKKVSSGQLSVDSVIDIALQIAQGLAKAHEKGIIHRDIKPANVMITNEGVVKILDFGLAKLAGHSSLTKDGVTLGTVAYMSPEQTRGEIVDHRTDIWALGVVLYEMLTGQLPFRGEYEQAVMYSILHEEPEPIVALHTGVPMELERIVNKSLAKNPDERYQHVDEMLVDLKSMGKNLESSVTKKSFVKAKFPKRSAKILYGAIVFFVVLIISGGIYFQQLGKEELPESSAQSQRTAAVSSSQWQNSIAVLPFKNISPDPEQEYFCDGMTEQIITNLSQLQALKVIARTSVMKFKNTQKTIPEIAEELHVAHILEGSIRKVGNQIRVTAQLIQADGGHHLWARDYDRELKDIFAVQDDVSEAIARALLKKLTVKETEEIKTRGTENAEAYEHYLKGRYFHDRKYYLTHRLDDFTKSESMFNKAIELDSNYAVAYAGLADLYDTYRELVAPEKRILDLRQKNIETAFRLAPHSAYVNVIKGLVHQNQPEPEVDNAYKSFKRALEINPNEPVAIFQMGVFLGLRGLYHQAIKYFTKAIELDPLDSSSALFRGWVNKMGGNFDQAIMDYQKTLELEPDYIYALEGLAQLSIMLKEYDQAEKLLARIDKLSPGNRYHKINRAWLYAAKGRKQEAIELLEESERTNRFQKIAVYSLLGLKVEAIRLLDKKPIAQYNQTGGDYLDMLHNPVFYILRDTEEFKVALQKAKEIYEENLRKYEEVFL